MVRTKKRAAKQRWTALGRCLSTSLPSCVRVLVCFEFFFLFWRGGGLCTFVLPMSPCVPMCKFTHKIQDSQPDYNNTNVNWHAVITDGPKCSVFGVFFLCVCVCVCVQDLEAAAAKDQTDLDAAKQKHDAKLTAWAEDHGKKRNVRTLLSTMHTVRKNLSFRTCFRKIHTRPNASCIPCLTGFLRISDTCGAEPYGRRSAVPRYARM